MSAGKVDWSATAAGLTGQALDRDGEALRYWTGGDPFGETVMLLHGATMDHRMWNAQIPELIERYRVIVWDARAHGKSGSFSEPRPTIDSYVDDAVALLDAIGVERVHLVGQSLGAYTAQHLIRRHPGRVASLVVVGATPIDQPLSRIDALGLRGSPWMFRLWPIGSLRRQLAKATSVDEDVREYVMNVTGALRSRDVARAFEIIATVVRREGFADTRIDMPFLLTHGEHDGTGNIRKDAPGWAERDPRIRYVVIPDAGHNANQDNPSFFNEELLAFLAAV